MNVRLIAGAALAVVATTSMSACSSSNDSSSSGSSSSAAGAATSSSAGTPSDASPSTSTASSPSSSTSGASGTYTLAEVAKHSTEKDCWVAIKAPGETKTGVYNVTTWIAKHPGGTTPIKGLCGKDGTSAFTTKHGEDGPQGKPEQRLASFKVGELTS